jgi:hypothetical protein
MWHPNNEVEACCELTALLEFFRATLGLSELTPHALRMWWETDPNGFTAAFARYDPQTNTPATRIAGVFAEYQSVIARVTQPSSNQATE